ncbi:plasmid recombination protein [Planktothrix sp. FACHB-1355]|uniref:Plasmid recombination protein n=1 Tax=Aerosakkonema funiforme FACHB-1375 TaxID=2949571 RepID=A0A926ZJS2_9CYAN|nr:MULTISPECIES: MobV family relaxase [Oscillatoriales]MBD2184959.1 plasmid recombination protein [Aerosakkonema funiforme FACHB-1375]MBD3559006.1 plasmid recombination protein [Planktothrix sp. FACHB-1355]
MAFGILQIQKIKSWGNLVSSSSHTSRDRETPNANPDVKNIRPIGNSDDPTLETLVRQKIGNQKIRSNAVLAVEMLLGASPDYFRPDNPESGGRYDLERLERWKLASVNWLKSEYGDLVVRAELHLDEITPHIHAYLVPLDEQGKLNCRALFGNRYKLSSLQDSYAAALSPIGIERGIKGSHATYTKIKEYYWHVNQEAPELDCFRSLPEPRSTESAIGYKQRVEQLLQPSVDVIDRQLSDRTLALKQKRDAEQKALASERERQKLEQRLKELEAQNRLLKAQTEQLHDLSLLDVAYELGLDCAESDIAKASIWHGHGYQFNITDSQFYDLTGSKRGNSAMDLVMQVNQCGLKQAQAWLADRFGCEGMLRAVTHYAREQAQQIIAVEPTRSFVPPESVESEWTAVQNYLIRERHLPKNLVNALHQRGLVYADGSGNAVFVMRELQGQVTGAIVWGTEGQRLAPGSKRSAGWFWMGLGGSEDSSIQRVALASSPIVALELLAAEYPSGSNTIYMAVDSDRTLPIDFLSTVPQVVLVDNNNPDNRQLVREIQKLLPQATRIKSKTIRTVHKRNSRELNLNQLG